MRIEKTNNQIKIKKENKTNKIFQPPPSYPLNHQGALLLAKRWLFLAKGSGVCEKNVMLQHRKNHGRGGFRELLGPVYKKIMGWVGTKENRKKIPQILWPTNIWTRKHPGYISVLFIFLLLNLCLLGITRRGIRATTFLGKERREKESCFVKNSQFCSRFPPLSPSSNLLKIYSSKSDRNSSLSFYKVIVSPNLEEREEERKRERGRKK